jgi:hypothetical protein
MTLIDKLEIGLKEDAPFRKDNLPEFQVRGPEIPSGPGRSAVVTESRTDPTGPPSEPELAAAEAAKGSPEDGG